MGADVEQKDITGRNSLDIAKLLESNNKNRYEEVVHFLTIIFKKGEKILLLNGNDISFHFNLELKNK